MQLICPLLLGHVMRQHSTVAKSRAPGTRLPRCLVFSALVSSSVKMRIITLSTLSWELNELVSIKHLGHWLASNKNINRAQMHFCFFPLLTTNYQLSFLVHVLLENWWLWLTPGFHALVASAYYSPLCRFGFYYNFQTAQLPLETFQTSQGQDFDWYRKITAILLGQLTAASWGKSTTADCSPLVGSGKEPLRGTCGEG